MKKAVLILAFLMVGVTVSPDYSSVEDGDDPYSHGDDNGHPGPI